MTDDQAAYLEGHGIDYAEAMERFGGNEGLYVRLAVKYLDDPHFHALEEAIDARDAAAVERQAHSLKGVAGNLSFVTLYDLASRITDAVRSGDLDGACELMPQLAESQEGVIEALAHLRG